MMVAAGIVYPVLAEEADEAEDEGVGDGLAPSSKSIVAGGDKGSEVVAYDCDINIWASCIESRGHTDGLQKK